MAKQYKCKGCGAKADHEIPISWWTFEFCCRPCWQVNDSCERLAKEER